MNYFSQNCDAGIVFRLRNDDAEAFREAFDNFFDLLIRKAMYYVRDEDAAKDVVQEIFLNVWKNRHRLRTTVPLKNYLERACINRCLNYLRDHGRLADERESDRVRNESLNVTPYTMLAYDEFQHRLYAFINAMPDSIRVPFVLSRFEQMTYREVAEATGMTELRVERSIMRALKLLRTFVGQHVN